MKLFKTQIADLPHGYPRETISLSINLCRSFFWLPVDHLSAHTSRTGTELVNRLKSSHSFWFGCFTVRSTHLDEVQGSYDTSTANTEDAFLGPPGQRMTKNILPLSEAKTTRRLIGFHWNLSGKRNPGSEKGERFEFSRLLIAKIRVRTLNRERERERL